MSIFRIEKNKNYTAMSNYHFQDMNLSLKAIGLLSKMLSLPDNWDYSQAGLAKICKDGEDSIGSALKELEKCGYLTRERERLANGRMGGMIYHVYEVPKDLIIEDDPSALVPEKKSKSIKSHSPKPNYPRRENPVLVNPVQANPEQEIPIQEFPKQENPPKINNNIINTNSLSNNKKNINSRIYSVNPSIQGKAERNITYSDKYTEDEYEEGYFENEYGYMEMIPAKDQIDRLIENKNGKKDFEIYNAVTEVVKQAVNYSYFKKQIDDAQERLYSDTDSISTDDYNLVCEENDLTKLNRLVGYIVDFVLNANTRPVRIARDLIPREVVKARILNANVEQIKNTIAKLSEEDIKNPKAYAIAVLYNS